MLKRTFDLVAAVSGVLILSPVMLLVGFLVGVTSPGGVFFRQCRVGLNGKEFQIYKFRTMYEDGSAAAGRFDAGSTARVTRVGRVLRKTKLDELPQLLNVICGSMSLVGPRPEIRKWVDCYPRDWEKVHVVRPGITDPASVEFRNEEELLAASANPEDEYKDVILPRKLFLYKEYVKNQSFLNDLRILLTTLIVTITR